MQWLQSPFANRFNRMVRDHGHVFQGRYKALLIEADAQKRRELHQALCRGWYIGTREGRKALLGISTKGHSEMGKVKICAATEKISQSVARERLSPSR